jgi:cob(I)alamin adenosyltransferase
VIYGQSPIVLWWRRLIVGDMPHDQSNDSRFDRKLAEAVYVLAVEVKALRDQKSSEFEWFKSHLQLATKTDLKEMEKRIMATQAELAADLKAVLEQQKKTSGEIKTVQDSVDALKVKVAELEAIIAAGGTIGQELIDAVAAVKAQAQVIDDQIPDVVV